MHSAKKPVVVKKELRAKAIPKLPASKVIKKAPKVKDIKLAKVVKPVLIAPLESKAVPLPKLFSRPGRPSAAGRPLTVERWTRNHPAPIITAEKVMAVMAKMLGQSVPKVEQKPSPKKTEAAKKHVEKLSK